MLIVFLVGYKIIIVYFLNIYNKMVEDKNKIIFGDGFCWVLEVEV